MRYSFLLPLIFCLAAPLYAQDELSPADVAGISGVPLMPGLTLLEDETVVFDKPGGRIVDAVASGPVLLPAVREYYLAVLDQFGWTSALPDIEDGLIVIRGGEVLHIRLRETEAGVRVHYSLAPYRPAP